MTSHDQAAALGIDLNDLFSAMLADDENTPPNWETEGREGGVTSEPLSATLFNMLILGT